MEFTLKLELRVEADETQHAALHKRVNLLLSNGELFALILNGIEGQGLEAEFSVRKSFKSCDECTGTTYPDEEHDDDCSLKPKTT